VGSFTETGVAESCMPGKRVLQPFVGPLLELHAIRIANCKGSLFASLKKKKKKKTI
jgi:hypothetical protein